MVVGLADVFDGFAFPALLSLLMVALVALARGMAPSLLATLVAAILLGALLHSTVPHLSENTEGRVVALALFLVAGGALSALAGRVERARRAAQLLARAGEQGRQDARIEAGRLDTVIDAMTNGLLVCDRDSRIMRTNRAARDILGFDAQSDAVAGSPHEWAARDAQGRPLTEERYTARDGDARGRTDPISVRRALRSSPCRATTSMPGISNQCATVDMERPRGGRRRYGLGLW